MTVAPKRASPSAMPRPSPRPAPVTMATRPLSDALHCRPLACHWLIGGCLLRTALAGASGNAGMISSANVRNASFEPVGSTSST